MTLELFQLHRVASDVFVLLELLKDPILQERGQDFCFEFGPQKRNPAITMESGRLAFFLGLLWGRFMLSNGNLECDLKKKRSEEFENKNKEIQLNTQFCWPKKQLQLQWLQSSNDSQVSFVDPWQNQCRPRPHLELKVDQLVQW